MVRMNRTMAKRDWETAAAAVWPAPASDDLFIGIADDALASLGRDIT